VEGGVELGCGVLLLGFVSVDLSLLLLVWRKGTGQGNWFSQEDERCACIGSWNWDLNWILNLANT